MTSNQLSTISSSGLTIRDGVDPIEFCSKFAAAAARMCGAKTEIDGQGINLVCLMEGINYIEFGRRYHMIQGRPSMRSDAMLAEFRTNHGGDFEIVERSAERAAIKFIDKKGRAYPMEFTWAEAQASRWPWNDWQDHDKGLKDSWATPTDRKSMLFARLVSDSLRSICPELVAGIYTPEEMQDALTIEQPARPAVTYQVTHTIEKFPSPEATGIADVMRRAESGTPSTAEGETVSEDGEIIEPVPTVESALITNRQAERIATLVAKVAMPQDKYAGMLAKRGVDSLEKLTKEQADEIIERLESLAQKK